MPKRVVDGEGVWGSDKLLALKEEYRPEYANLVPLAEANGVFEADPYKVWSRVYSYNRRDITVEWVAGLLQDLVRVGMLLLWEDKGKIWGYWEGNQKAGRLPSPSEQQKYKNLPVSPPKNLLSDSSETSISLLPRLGMVGSEKDRSVQEPAAQENEDTFNNDGQGETMKLKDELTKIAAQYGAKAGGHKGTWDDVKALGIAHGTGAVARDFEEWMQENQGDDFSWGALSAYNQVAADRLSSDSPLQASAKDPEVVSLVRELSYVSGGQICFVDKQRARLAEVLKEFTTEEIKSAFKTWVETQDLNDTKNLSYAPGKFVQIVDNLTYAARKQKQEAEEAKTQRDAAVVKMQEQAERERKQAEEKKAEEADVFDPLAELLSETDQTVV